MRFAFIGYGEAARAWSASLREAGASGITAFDVAQDGERAEEFKFAAAENQVALLRDPLAACKAQIIFSAVTAADSVNAANSVRGALGPENTFVDINSVSPKRKHETAKIIRATGAKYVDMAVMAPVHPNGHRTPCLVAGDSLPDGFKALGFNFSEISEEPGAATAIKMIRSLFVKGIEAITLQAMCAAEKAGCFEEVYESISDSFPGLGWPEFGTYHIERVATHGIRRSAEMKESSATLAELGLPEGAALASAIANVHEAVGILGLQAETSGLQTIVQQMLGGAMKPQTPSG